MRFDGKTTRRRFKKLRLDEISLVDQPASGPALVAIMKRAGEPTEKNRMALTTLAAGHTHSIVMVEAEAGEYAELKAGKTGESHFHVHDWIMDDAGNIIIGDADGHNHGVSALVKATDDVTNESLAEGVSASLGQPKTQAGTTKAADSGTTEIQDMTPEEQAAFEKAAEDKLAIEKARADRAEAVVQLSPSQRAHFDALAPEGQDEFLKAEDKDAIVKNAADSDPVVYKSLDGDEFRKSDDPRLVKAAQRADKAEKAVAEAELVAKRNDLVKRAGEELAHLTGELTAKADLLGAVDSLPVEKREAVVAILKSKDAGMQKAFETLGTADAGADADSPAAKLDTLAKAKAEANPNLTPEQAYSAVLDTPEGRELHAQL